MGSNPIRRTIQLMEMNLDDCFSVPCYAERMDPNTYVNRTYRLSIENDRRAAVAEEARQAREWRENTNRASESRPYIDGGFY